MPCLVCDGDQAKIMLRYNRGFFAQLVIPKTADGLEQSNGSRLAPSMAIAPRYDAREERRRLLSRMASRPDFVFGPVLKPPCNLQRPFRAWSLSRFHTAGARHGGPLRVRALQRGRSARFKRGSLARRLRTSSPRRFK